MYLVKEVNYSDWKENFQNCQKTNMLQCWQYGDAKVETSKWNVVRFLVMDRNDNAVALAQALCITLPLIGGIARMNRGPLLIKRSESEQDSKDIFNIITALLDEFKTIWDNDELIIPLPGKFLIGLDIVKEKFDLIESIETGNYIWYNSINPFRPKKESWDKHIMHVYKRKN